MQKACKTCSATKEETDFYANDKSCKECRKGKVRAHRAANLDRIQAYDRQRGQDQNRKQANRENYFRRTSTTEGRDREFARSRAWMASNRDKRDAHIAVGNALRDGYLTRQPCERCGDEQSNAHHEDYSKKLEVNWLCKPCHGARHREINAERRQMERHTG